MIDYEGAGAIERAAERSADQLRVLEQLRAETHPETRSELYALYRRLGTEESREMKRWWHARVRSGFAPYPPAPDQAAAEDWTPLGDRL